MNVQSLLAALVDLLQPVVDHPLVFALAIVIVTAFGVPAKRLLAAVGTLAHVPGRFARSELAPALGRTHPWTLGRLLGKLRSYFGPVFDRPARALGGAIGRTARLIARATAWPIDRITGLILRFVDPFLHELSQLLDPIAARASAASGAALAALSTDGRWVGWRVIGGLLFFVGLCLFLFADAALAIASHEKAVGVAVAFLPDWLKEVTLAYAVASFLSALMLGLVVFDLAGMTHLGPWNELTGRRRSWLAGIVIATACVSLVLATFLSLWRASVILPDFIPADTARTLEGWALTLPIPLLLIATALIGWGAIAMPWILWIVVTAIGSFVLSLLSTLLRVLAVVLPTVVAFLGEVLRILGILGLCVAIGLLCVTLAAVFVGISIALAEILVLGAVGVALWAAAWLVGMIVVAVLDLVAAIVDGLVGFAQHIVHALMYPGAGIWNWVASFDSSHRWHLRPIPMGTTGRSDRDDEDDARAKPVAA
jgi:hypothetical protein